jgi:phosphatidylinositol alpha 1,6-mannosyltransferase
MDIVTTPVGAVPSLAPVLEDVEMDSGHVGKDARRPADSELRIIIFTACYFVLDGVTLTIRRLESHLRARGATVKILTTVPDDYDQEATKDLIVVPGIKIPFTHAGTGYAFGSGLVDSVIREIEKFNPNCIHFTVPDLVSLEGIKYCQRKNIAYMATWHSNYVDYLQYYYVDWLLKIPFQRYLQGFYEQMPVVYVPTPYMKNKMAEEGFGVHAKIEEWGRGVDLKLFSPDRRSNAFRAARGISETDVVVVWVGRLVPEKRPDIWMECLSRFAEEGLPVKGLVVGHGTYEATLANMSNVTCTGWLSGVGLAEAYASADIFLFPSAVETFGNVTLEASSSGCVCIVEENCSGHLVVNGHNGFTVPAGDSEGFYQATKRVVTDNALRRLMSQHSREYSWRYERNKILQMMAENYKDAVVRHSDPSYIKNRISSSPEVAGRNILSVLCCNYSLIRHILEPLLNTTNTFSNVAHNCNECVSSCKSRAISGANICSCGLGSHCLPTTVIRKDHMKGHDAATMRTSQQVGFLVNAFNWIGSVLAYALILLFIYASFTV